MWYNKRGMALFYIIAIAPRCEFAAKGRQTPKGVSLRYNKRGMALFYEVFII